MLEAGKAIVDYCGERSCTVAAMVGKVAGKDLVGIPACCDLWIKKVLHMD
jgi:hypothetical protein